MARPLKEILEKNGERYVVMGVAPIEDKEAYRNLQQIQRDLQRQGYSVLLEKEYLRGRNIFRLLRSVKPTSRQERPPIPEEVIHEE